METIGPKREGLDIVCQTLFLRIMYLKSKLFNAVDDGVNLDPARKTGVEDIIKDSLEDFMETMEQLKDALQDWSDRGCSLTSIRPGTSL
jgi:hypothetical protein